MLASGRLEPGRFGEGGVKRTLALLGADIDTLGTHERARPATPRNPNTAGQIAFLTVPHRLTAEPAL